MKRKYLLEVLYLIFACLISYPSAIAQSPENNLNNQKMDGYKGIWFTLNQFYEYGDKYSGGLGTYTAKHAPLAIYAPDADKTFFVYGGTKSENDKYLLCMIGSYDHKSKIVSKPTIVHDKQGVDDPHDNPSLLIDDQGYIWIFVSGRGQSRPGFKYKSNKPFNIEAFDQITTEEMTYPQPWYIPGQGFFHFFTKYTGIRELYYETSKDGAIWTEDRKLAGIKGEGNEKSGHYQVSNHFGNKLVTFFNWHPNGDVDQRTDLYFLQSVDFGNSWTTIEGLKLQTPLTETNSPAKIYDYYSQGKNVYVKDVSFDKDGNPLCLYITSGGHEPGPKNDPRNWNLAHWNGNIWENHIITTSDHNYDMGSLFVDNDTWRIVAPTKNAPQKYGGGGEVEIWESNDQGKNWVKKKQITSNSPRNHNYIRKVINGSKDFLYFWADGNPDEFSQSQLYFGDADGKVWRLPYEMKEESAKPELVE